MHGLGQDVFGGGYRIAQKASCPGVITALFPSFSCCPSLTLSLFLPPLHQDQRLIQEGHLMRVDATAFRDLRSRGRRRGQSEAIRKPEKLLGFYLEKGKQLETLSVIWFCSK